MERRSKERERRGENVCVYTHHLHTLPFMVIIYPDTLVYKGKGKDRLLRKKLRAD